MNNSSPTCQFAGTLPACSRVPLPRSQRLFDYTVRVVQLWQQRRGAPKLSKADKLADRPQLERHLNDHVLRDIGLIDSLPPRDGGRGWERD
ncbi:hypothetical protein [Paraherbaspirillum soli]|uniref:DUF1127 domain-containing protein n=1 Tax=Paraherbaspirillum soli TaxID=631222 RepID=A0ABW0M8E6_9BURK